MYVCMYCDFKSYIFVNAHIQNIQEYKHIYMHTHMQASFSAYLDRYLDDSRTSPMWGDNYTLQAIATIFDVDIKVDICGILINPHIL